MKLLDALVEQRIAAAARDEFDGLPSAAQALASDGDAQIPEEVRVASRILKNAGFEPPALEQLRALCDLNGEAERMRAASPVAGQAPCARRGPPEARWLALNMALESLRGGPLVVPNEYRRRLAERLAGHQPPVSVAPASRVTPPADAGKSVPS